MAEREKSEGQPPAKRPKLNDDGSATAMAWRPSTSGANEARPNQRSQWGDAGRGSFRGRGSSRGGRGGGASRFGEGRPDSTSGGSPRIVAKQPQVEPAAVGITFFLSSDDEEGIRTPFTGELKARYTDFIVQEIDSRGRVVRLTDTSASVPDDIVEQVKRMSYEERCDAVLDIAKPLLATEDLAALAAFLPQPPLEPAAETEARVAAPALPLQRELIVAAPSAREDRTKLFEAARLYLGKEIICDTAKSAPIAAVSSDASGASAANAAGTRSQGVTTNISFVKKAVGKGNNDNSQNQQLLQQQTQWPSVRPDFLQFVLYKQNIDTPSAIAAICRATGLKDKTFGYAGTKDKRAVTTQLVTAYKVQPQRLAGLNYSANSVRGVVMGNFSFVKNPIRLGNLSGNRFTLTIKAVKLTSSTAMGASSSATPSLDDTQAAIERSLSSWKATTGCRFPNYFGLQRFGNASAPTHIKGRLMLKHDYQGLIESFFAETPAASNTAAAAAGAGTAVDSAISEDFRAYFRATKDVKGTLERLQRSPSSGSHHVEFALLRELDYRGGFSSSGACACAIRVIPPRIRNLYIHAYQSRLWNFMVTERLKKHGLEVVEGDLVVVGNSDDNEEVEGGENDGGNEGDESAAKEECSSAGAGKVKDASAPASSSSSSAAAGAAADGPELIEVRLVTAEDVATKRFTIDDVALPMVGLTTKLFPALEGLTASSVARMLREDGLPILSSTTADAGKEEDDNLAGEAMRTFFNHKDSAYRVLGTYRRIISTGKDVEWSFHRYRGAGEEDINKTDLDLLEPSMRAKVKSIPLAPPPVVQPAATEAVAGAPASSSSSSSAAADGAGEEAVAVEASSAAAAPAEEEKLALRISFSLTKSSYATMLMREVMRNDEAAATAAE
jgi:tRNA pseudouridine13 synthase